MNQNREQLARDRIDKQLTACGWIIQNKSSINLHAAIGVAIREYQTDIGPADYGERYGSWLTKRRIELSLNKMKN